MVNDSKEDDILDKALYQVREILQADLDKYWDAVEKENDQFWRRGFVRAAFAYIEGFIYTIKLEALFMHQILRSTIPRKKLDLKEGATLQDFTKALGERMAEILKGAGFSPIELLYLVEITADLDENGELKAKWGAKISLEKNFVFAFRAYAQAFGVKYKVDKSGQGWQDLKKAIKVRDRLMHPKRVHDLTVTEDELAQVMRSCTWLLDCLVNVSKLIKESKKSDESQESA